MKKQYLEDLTPGQTFGSGSHQVTAEEIKRFASEFDPQPFHIDEEGAVESLFGGLASSGWHTASLSAKLLVQSAFQPAGGIIGLSVDELRWKAPVRTGDELRVSTEVLDARPSRSRPSHGVVKVRVSTLNQSGTLVQSFVLHLLILRRSRGEELARS